MFVDLTEGLDVKFTAPWPEHYMKGLEEFFAGGEDRQSPAKSCYPRQAVFDSVMFPLQRQREMEAMLHMAHGAYVYTILEIGSDKGGSLYHWCCLSTVRRVVAIEITGMPYRDYFEKAFPHIEFLWIHGSSYDEAAVKAVADFLGESKFDCIFLDGDKCRFLDDFSFYSPMVRKGGLCFVHDIHDDGPRDAWAKMVPGRITAEVIDTRDSAEAVIRERDGVECTGSYEGWLRHWQGKSCGVGIVYL
jgi:predicted O-methyltransferase YrrM